VFLILPNHTSYHFLLSFFYFLHFYLIFAVLASSIFFSLQHFLCIFFTIQLPACSFFYYPSGHLICVNASSSQTLVRDPGSRNKSFCWPKNYYYYYSANFPRTLGKYLLAIFLVYSVWNDFTRKKNVITILSLVSVCCVRVCYVRIYDEKKKYHDERQLLFFSPFHRCTITFDVLRVTLLKRSGLRQTCKKSGGSKSNPVRRRDTKFASLFIFHFLIFLFE